MVTQNTKSVSFVLGFLLMLNSISGASVAASIGNAKMVLYPEVNGWTTTTTEKTILVRNVNDVPVNITLQVDKGSEEGLLELEDHGFVLQPGEERDAKFNVKVKKEGNYEGRINVFFSPVSDGNEETNGTVKTGGVVLSSNIVVIARKDQAGYQESKDSDETYQSPLSGKVISGSNPAMLLMIGSFILTIILLAVLIMILKRSNKKSGGELNGKKKK